MLNFIYIDENTCEKKKKAVKIPFSLTTVIFGNGQDHSNLYQTADFTSVHNYTNFERNCVRIIISESKLTF